MGLHRPYIRKSVRMEVENRALKNEEGQFLDANTGKPIEGKYDLGHKTGHEFRIAKKEAEAQGLTQSQFNELQNAPDLYQIEDPSVNRSHAFEQKDNAAENPSAQSASGMKGSENNGVDGGVDGGME